MVAVFFMAYWTLRGNFRSVSTALDFALHTQRLSDFAFTAFSCLGSHSSKTYLMFTEILLIS